MGSRLAIISLGEGVMCVIEFKKAQITVNPQTSEKAEHLVTSGIYQYSRNPMYVGLVFILLG